MSDIYKFPSGGYEVTVFKKQDILDCIDNNILDKEIAFFADKSGFSAKINGTKKYSYLLIK